MSWCDFCNRTNIPKEQIKIIKTNIQTIFVCERCLMDLWAKNSYGGDVKDGKNKRGFGEKQRTESRNHF